MPTTPRAWTKRDERRLRALYPTHRQKECAAALQRTAKAIASRAKLLGLRRIRDCHRWTAAEVHELRAIYPNSPTREVARRMGVSVHQVNGKRAMLGLHKEAAYLAGPYKKLLAGLGNGIRHRFPKGHVPANKGLRRPGWFAGRTQFQKGQRPRNTLPVGTVMPNSAGYMRIKISDAPEPSHAKGANSRNWEFVHRRVWEAAHGPIPKGHRIWWKDRNHGNCALENLELLSDAEHMRRTTIHNLPPDLKKACQALGAVRRKLTLIRKKGARDAQEQVARSA